MNRDLPVVLSKHAEKRGFQHSRFALFADGVRQRFHLAQRRFRACIGAQVPDERDLPA